MLKDVIEIDPAKKWLNAKECAAYLGITVKAVYCQVHRGELPHYKKGKKLYFLREELDQILLNSRTSPRTSTSDKFDKVN